MGPFKNCEDCQEKNKVFEILAILRWRAYNNYLSGLAFDQGTRQILVNKDSLMRAIQMANPGQAYRDIRLVSDEEYKKIQDKSSDFTSWDEQERREKAEEQLFHQIKD